MAKQLKATEVKVPCRVSFVHVLEPDKNGSYSCSLLVPKTDTITIEKLNKAINAAIEEGKTKLGNKEGYVNKKMLKLPLRDADEEENSQEGYAGMIFFNAKNKRRKPQVVNRRLDLIFDPDEIYSGCYCNVMIEFYAFSVDGNKGVAASLGNIQKVRDGERLGYGGRNADADFDDLGDDEEAPEAWNF